jgi:hypothetical protein
MRESGRQSRSLAHRVFVKIESSPAGAAGAKGWAIARWRQQLQRRAIITPIHDQGYKLSILLMRDSR